MNIMRTLPTCSVSEIVDSVRPRLYINFFDRLPPEVCLKVLGYLDPLSLIRTAQASRDWMSLSMDGKLWEHLYYMEGWRIIPSELEQFERDLAKRQALPARARPSFDMGNEQAHKKRATPKLMAASIHSNDDAEMPDVDAIPSPKQDSLFWRPGLQLTANASMAIEEPVIGGSRAFPPRSLGDVDEHQNSLLSRQAFQSLQDKSDRRNSAWSSKSGG